MNFILYLLTLSGVYFAALLILMLVESTAARARWTRPPSAAADAQSRQAAA